MLRLKLNHVIKGKPSFLMKYKLQTISPEIFTKYSKPIAVYMSLLKMWGHHINFCMTAILDKWKMNINLEGNHNNGT